MSSTLHSSRRLWRGALAAAALGGGLLLCGCVIAPVGAAYPVDDGPVVVAPYAPPPVQAEVVTVAPSPLHVWINGYWGWGGASYGWTPGRWAVPPRGGYVWHPRRWDHGPRGWQQRGGHWGPH